MKTLILTLLLSFTAEAEHFTNQIDEAFAPAKCLYMGAVTKNTRSCCEKTSDDEKNQVQKGPYKGFYVCGMIPASLTLLSS